MYKSTIEMCKENERDGVCRENILNIFQITKCVSDFAVHFLISCIVNVIIIMTN